MASATTSEGGTGARSPRVQRYAEALYTVIASEPGAVGVEDELYRVARAVEASDELRTTLSDPHIPSERRQQIVEDLLGGRAADLTTALVSMVVGAGRARELPAIVDTLAELSAAQRSKAVAEVRSAIELTPEQRSRLAAALSGATGKEIEVKVIVDPSVLGGIVTRVGDQILDGTVRSRLAQLRESLI